MQERQEFLSGSILSSSREYPSRYNYRLHILFLRDTLAAVTGIFWVQYPTPGVFTSAQGTPMVRPETWEFFFAAQFHLLLIFIFWTPHWVERKVRRRLLVKADRHLNVVRYVAEVLTRLHNLVTLFLEVWIPTLLLFINYSLFGTRHEVSLALCSYHHRCMFSLTMFGKSRQFK
jgi:hypothetical protein